MCLNLYQKYGPTAKYQSVTIFIMELCEKKRGPILEVEYTLTPLVSRIEQHSFMT